MEKISYTFPPDCPTPELAGITVHGGVFAEMLIGGKPEIVAKFETLIAGKRVVAKVTGKPELEALYEISQAFEADKQARLKQIGWAQYRAVQERYYAALGAYDTASEYGYPAREAAALREAEAARAQARIDYPDAAAYAEAESFSCAANDQKAAAGRAAMKDIIHGVPPSTAIEKMREAWSQAAMRAVERD